jgi:hypothetical protein
LDREIRVGVLPEGPTGPDGEPLDGGYAQPAVAAVRFSGLRVVGRDSLERDSGRPWEFLGALMTPRGPIGREQAGSPAGHPDGVLGGRPSQVRAILTGRPRRIGHLPRRDPPSSILWVPAGPQSAHRPRRPRRPAPVAAPRPECEVHRRVRRRLRRRGDQGAHYAGAGAAGGRLRRWPR